MATARTLFNRRAMASFCFGAVIAAAVLGSCRPPGPSRRPDAARSSVEEGFFPGADGVQLFYRKVGTGSATAVYLHGGPLDMADGGYELDALAAGRTLIAFDQRSGGRSQLVGDSAHLTADYYVRDVEALRQHFGLKQMMLIGQSWGAMLAAMYTARHPEAVTRLLLLSPGPPAPMFWPQRLEKTNAATGEVGLRRVAELERQMLTAPDDTIRALCQERMEIIFRAYLNDVSALRRMRVGYCDAPPAALRHELAADGFLAWDDFDLLPKLATFQQPALLVEGANTQVPLEATRAWAAALPNGRLLLVPGASHMTWLEGDVPKLMRALNQFLAGDWPQGAEIVRP